MKKKAIFLLLFFSVFCCAQNVVSGIVKDINTKTFLPFATIKTADGKKIIANVDGSFTIDAAVGSKIIISYAGYNQAKISIEKNTKTDIFLEPNFFEIEKKRKSSSQSALDLLQQIIAKKKQNNPQFKLKNFQFKAYNKIIVTANPDSIAAKIDTLFSIRKAKKIDSTSYKFKKIVEKNHLFEIEKVSLFQFESEQSKETIIGSKISGFKQPVFEILGFTLQSLSLYDDYYTLLGKKYFSPIVGNSIKKYVYKILDTVTYQNRNTILLYFQGKNKATTLEGLFYIDTDTKGIAKAIYRNRSIVDVSTIYNFSYDVDKRLWFPAKSGFKIKKGNNKEDIKILGGTIAFDGDETKNFKKRKREPSDFVYALSETRYFDVTFDKTDVNSRKFVKMDMQKEAFIQSEKFWTAFRKDTIDKRSAQTYTFADSLFLKNGVEKKYFFGKKIVNGFIPIAFIDVDLRKIFNYNNYEGFRICLALQSNEFFSKTLRFSGFVAYGTKDGNFKYNFSAASRIGKKSTSWIGLSYTDDIQEIGSTTFSIENRTSQLFDTSLFNISSFYNYEQWRAFFETKIIPKTESIWEFSTSNIDPKFNYFFLNNGQSFSKYNLSTVQLSLKWHPFSDYMQTANGLIEMETGFPKFTFQFTKSLPKILKNDFDFTKLDFKTEYEQQYLDGQLTNFIFSMGFAIGNAPLTHLYNNSPNSLNKATVLQRTVPVGENDFETMYFNEFFSNQYAFFQFRHEFKSFEIARKIKPNFVFITRAAIGNLLNKENHGGLLFKTLDQGYLESGVQLNKIFKGLGFGAYYRYGANHLPDFADNIALRFSYKFNLGL